MYLVLSLVLSVMQTARLSQLLHAWSQLHSDCCLLQNLHSLKQMWSLESRLQVSSVGIRLLID